MEVACSWSKRDEILSNWDALRANPEQWYDNRARKTNPRAPDFVRKDDRSVAIWVDARDVPDNVEEVLAEVGARRAPGAGSANGDRRAEELTLWEALRDNPDEWYDNRRRKTNPRAPDFLRKDNRNVALWVDSYNAPDWAPELMAELDARRAAAPPRAGYAPGDSDARRAEEAAKWESLRSNPAEWYDNRNRKLNERQPDFKRRDDRNVALWLTSRNLPPWIDELLADLDARAAARAEQRNAQWGQQQQQGAYGAPEQQYQEQAYQDQAYQVPQQAYEQQGYPQQQQQGYPQEGYQRRPQQQQGGAGGFDREAKRAAEAANWEALRNNPQEWYDNRHTKTNPKAPDFKRKDDKTVVLWVESYQAPEWLGSFLEELDARQHVPV